jgi:hypothetical protein
MCSLSWCSRVLTLCMFLYVWSFYIFVCGLHFLYLIDVQFIFIFSSSLVCILCMEMLRKSFFGVIFRHSLITWYLRRFWPFLFIYFSHMQCVVPIYENTAELFLAMFVLLFLVSASQMTYQAQIWNWQVWW